MDRKKDASDIISRVEYLRNYLGLNKSRFSTEIGMKPQTYNNFIGAQGSRPSVDLLLGMVTRYNANPTWLLTGKGPLFIEGNGENEGESLVAEGGRPLPFGGSPLLLDDIFRKLRSMERTLQEVSGRLAHLEEGEGGVMNELVKSVEKLLIADPAKAEKEIKAFIQKLG